VLLGLTGPFTAWQKARFRAILGVELVPFPAPDPARRRRPWPATRYIWRQACYHALGGAFSTVAIVAVISGVVAGVMLPMGGLVGNRLAVGARFIMLTGGLALLFLAPWLTRAAVALDLFLARSLLQPPETDALVRRVESLSTSRAGAIDAADAERRRIERNLHDGTQQRLVSLAMNLGMTRAAVRDAEPGQYRRSALLREQSDHGERAEHGKRPQQPAGDQVSHLPLGPARPQRGRYRTPPLHHHDATLASGDPAGDGISTRSVPVPGATP